MSRESDDDAPIYLDHNATTPVHPEVRAAMLPWLGERWGNPSSGHAFGRAAAAAVAAARAEVAALVGAAPAEIVFCSGGTEADDLAILGAAGAMGAAGRLVISAVEHPAVEGPASELEARGWSTSRLAVDAGGAVDPMEAAAVARAAPPDLVSVILAQNETGALQPVAEVARAMRAANPRVVIHSDAAQAVGKVAVDVTALGVDLLTIVGHKLYAPAGIGALYVRAGTRLQPRLRGGGQEGGLRAGTEPVAAIVGLGAACSLARRTLAAEVARQVALREVLWARLAAGVPGIRRTAAGARSLPGTLHVCFPGATGAAVLARTPGVAASTGSACHGHGGGGGVLAAMGVPAEVRGGAVRLSLGRITDAAAIERAGALLTAGWEAARRG